MATRDEIINASVLHAAGDLRLETRKIVDPASDEVQVSIKRTGLCGSDVHYYKHFANGDIRILEPISLGHECAGVVVKVGTAVPSEVLKVGDIVALEVALPCGDLSNCEYCARGRYNLCPHVRCRGSAKSFPHFQGTLQDKVNHPFKWTHKMPHGATADQGALLEPLCVALHAIERAALPPRPCRILVLGAGAVGLLVAQALTARDHSVIVADISAERVQFAQENSFADGGVVFPLRKAASMDEKIEVAKANKKLATNINSTKVLNNSSSSNGSFANRTSSEALYDTVFECTGVETCVQTAIFASKAGGKVVLVGMGQPIQSLYLSSAALREVDMLGVFRYAGNYSEGIEMLAADKLKGMEKIVTHRFDGLQNVPKAFEMACKTVDEDGKLVLKVMIDV